MRRDEIWLSICDKTIQNHSIAMTNQLNSNIFSLVLWHVFQLDSETFSHLNLKQLDWI